MNSNKHGSDLGNGNSPDGTNSKGPHPDNPPPSVGDQNVERLLAGAYQPESITAAFADRVRAAALEQSVLNQSAARRGSDAPHAPSAPPHGWADVARWWTVAAATAAVAFIGAVVWLSGDPAPRPETVYRDGELVWIDGQPYILARRQGASAGTQPLQPAAASPRQARSLTLVSNAGMRPRPRGAGPRAERAAPGDSIVTGAGERLRVTLSDGSLLLVNENTAVDVAGRRRLTVKRGDVFVTVAPAPAPETPRKASVEALPRAEENGDDKPADAKPGDSKLAEAKLAEAKPADENSRDAKRGVSEAPMGERESAAPFQVIVPPLQLEAFDDARRIEADGPASFYLAVRNQSAQVAVTHGTLNATGVAEALVAGQQVELPAPDASQGAVAGGDAKIRTLQRTDRIPEWTRDLIASAESPLVPRSEHAGGALEAIDAEGRRAPLTLRKYHLDVHIEDGFARTTIDQTYFNHLAGRLEGTFYFPLPPDASISRLAMYVNGKLMEGGMAERDHARNVFETIKHRALDPALLEWVDGSTFKMRVFPLEGRQEKRIVLSYTQKLPLDEGRATYRFPAGHNLKRSTAWSARLRLVGAAESPWQCGSHKLAAEKRDGDLVLTSSAKQAGLDRDLAVQFDDPAAGDRPRFASIAYEGRQYLMLRMRPPLPTESASRRRDWVFLLDADGSRDPLLARVQIDLVRTLLERAAVGDTFSIITAGTRQHAFAERQREVNPQNLQAATEFLESMHLLGALDLQQALTTARGFVEAAESPVLVHVGGAIPILGSRDTDVLLRELDVRAPYVGVAVGKRWNRNWMKAAARTTGGYVAQVNPDESPELRGLELLAALNGPRLLGVSVQSDEPNPQPFYLIEDQVEQGGEICAVAQWDREGLEGVSSVTVKAQLDGKPFEKTVAVADVADDAHYLPRTWAKLAIEALVAEDAKGHKDEIVELSKAMYVMSPFTSLLVLENEEMYLQHKIDCGRKDHWAIYPAPKEIKVVSETPAGPEAPPETSANRGEKAAETAETVLKSLWIPMSDGGAANWFLALGGDSKASFPDGGTVLAGGVRLTDRGIGRLLRIHSSRRGNSGPVSLYPDPDSIGPSVTIGLDPMGNPTADLDFVFGPASFGAAAPQLGGFNAEYRMGHHFILDRFDNVGDENGDGGSFYMPYYTTRGPRDFLGGNGHGGAASADFEELIDLIESTVRTDTWETEPFASNLSLVVRQTQTVFSNDGDRLVDFGAWQELRSRRFNGDRAHLHIIPSLIPSLKGFSPSSRRASARIAARLQEKVSVNFKDRGLRDALQELGRHVGLEFAIDEMSLRDARVSPDASVTLQLSQPVKLSSALNLLLAPLKLGYFVSSEAVEIGALDDLQSLKAARLLGDDDWLMLFSRQAGPRRDAPRSPAWTAEQREFAASGVWRRLTKGHQPADCLFPRRLGAGDRSALRRLALFAPGITSTAADALAALERESDLAPPRRGTVDPRAAELIAAARRGGWRNAIWKNFQGAPQRLALDGQGSFRLERLSDAGLRETIVCDGKTLRHYYPELGLGTVREVSRFHRLEFAGAAPWLTPAADDLAVGHDVRLIGPRTVALVPLANPSRDAAGPDGKPGEEHGESDGESDGENDGENDGEDDGEDTDAAWGSEDDSADPADPADPAGRDTTMAPTTRVHLVFGEDGRLKERQLVELPSGAPRLRVVLEAGGSVRWLDAEGEAVRELRVEFSVAAAPQLQEEERELVMLPMPIRSPSHLKAEVQERRAASDAPAPAAPESADALERIARQASAPKNDPVDWPERDLLRLLVANHWSKPSEMRALIGRRFFARGDRRLGFYTLLLSSGLHWDLDQPVPLGDGTTTSMNPLADHPNSALAGYLAEELDAPPLPATPDASGSAKKGSRAERSDSPGSDSPNSAPEDSAPEDSAPDGGVANLPAAPRPVLQATRLPADGNRFIEQLNEYRILLACTSPAAELSGDAARRQADLDRLFRFVGQCDSPRQAYVLLQRLQQQAGREQPHARIAAALLELEKKWPVSYAVKYQLARSLAASGRKEAAQRLFLQLYQEAFEAGRLPLIDRPFVDSLKKYKGELPLPRGEGDPAGFAGLMHAACRSLIARRQRLAALALVEQCRQLNETALAEELFDLCLTGLDADDQFATTLAAVDHLLANGERGRAARRLAPLLESTTWNTSPSLWRLASEIARLDDRLGAAIQGLEEALELEYSMLAGSYSVERWKASYQSLFQHYLRLATLIAGLSDDSPRDALIARVVKSADRWRQLAPDPTEACNSAADILHALGAGALAWDYLTTPLALKPNESTAWLKLAETLAAQDQASLAIRAYEQAFAAEPTNPEILWSQAQLLEKDGQRGAAQRLYRQIASAQWQPRFQSIQRRAERSIVEEHR